MGSVNLHESEEPSGECSERQKQIFCELKKTKTKRTPTTIPTVFGPRLPNIQMFFPSLQKITVMLQSFWKKERPRGFTAVYLQSSVGCLPRIQWSKTWRMAFAWALVCDPSRQPPQTCSSTLSYVAINCEYRSPGDLSCFAAGRQGTITLNRTLARPLIPKAIAIPPVALTSSEESA